jgi:hypothetical protein
MATTLYPYYPPKSVDKIMHSSSRGMSIRCMLIAITMTKRKGLSKSLKAKIKTKKNKKNKKKLCYKLTNRNL